MTPKTTIELLDACKAGKPPKLTKWASKPLNGQVSCEGPLGKTSLKTIPPAPKSRDFAPKVDPATIKNAMMY